MVNGKIFNLQRYSLHDGPGIRTTVFLKGCPLNCWWCHNPESQSFETQTVFYENRCIKCNKCEDGCCTDAIETIGQNYSISQVMNEVQKDRVFYEESKGGVTFSGGEPLSQIEFLLELLKACKRSEIHTTVDTCGYAKNHDIIEVSKYTDLFLYDIKLINAEEHIKYTGVSNKLIIENLKSLIKLKKRIFARMPLIWGINDGDKNISDTINLIKRLGGIEKINILPYHNIAKDKYDRLNLQYKLAEIGLPDEKHANKIVYRFCKNGINAVLGG